ncbi:RNA-splicing ligase RtcB [Paenibacillus chitinolyticus]|uniref:RtcB family protein n=1 Tax=Paenibacillus chitinolyticus TaxID=79263 RepID=UPI0026E4B3CF|nr:RtcB family protein [Paenibacillus chitinolyticus]GKS14891.1 RNA-splicing ligase RtcB [Paenibacillus chitinolyticus]
MFNIPVHFFINHEVKVEQNAKEELARLLQINETIERIRDFDTSYFKSDAGVTEVAITPDFHKGAGIPVGTTLFTRGMAIPQAIGNDINCGMRLYVTNLTEEKIRNHLDEIEKKIRYVFFEGGRNIPMTRRMREKLFTEGLIGLLETFSDVKGKGLWNHYDAKQQESDLNRVNKLGSFIADEAVALDDFLGPEGISHDSQIGSIGGGNHFVEIQVVREIKNSSVAHAWGLRKGQVVFMIHTGSVAIGHHAGNHIRQMMRDMYPKNLKHPENGIYPLPHSDRFQSQWQQFWNHLHNAANFAFANRLTLGLMLHKAISDVVGDFEQELLYDAPNNYLWEETIDNTNGFLHRKGSCTAKSPEQMQGTPFAYTGEPVFIPGSMGSHSFILAGLGNRNSLFSASHGAGRALSRGEAVKVDDVKFRGFIEKFRVINPIDPKRTDLRGRMDILKKWEEELKKEAPYAYKEITPIIQSHVDFGMADIVAEVAPIATVKG